MPNESAMTIETDGRKAWRNKQGQRHRLDGPAIEDADGTKYWYQKDQLHRTDRPAIEHADGSKEWYQKGQLHRTDGPAIEHANGTKHWYQKGKLHRRDEPAIEDADGSKYWYIKGKRRYAAVCFREGQTTKKQYVETYAQAYEMMCENLRNEICSWVEELK